MSNVTDAIKNRRSIRKLASKTVPKKILGEILEAARWAPSAHNAQPWRFIILTEKSSKKNFAKAMAKAWLTDLTIDRVAAETRKEIVKASVERFTNTPVLIIA